MQALAFSVFIGMMAVLQGGLNRQISGKYGLHVAFLINSLVFLVIAGSYWFFSSRTATADFKMEWWYIFPGIFGAMLVFGIPWAIPQIGALRVFLCLVGGQMVMSLLWDSFIEKRPPDLQTLVGTMLTLSGLAVANWQKV
ncbi:MAG: DMT family transporter [Pseudobdellovibrio sp.]